MRKNRKLSIEQMQQIAKARGGKCLSETYVNNKHKLLWECAEGHKWEAIPQSIRQGSWCPHCAGLAKGTIKEMQQIAEARGGECLSETYVDSTTKLLWQCVKGHQWEAVSDSIKRGRWCPYCGGSMKGTIEEM